MKIQVGECRSEECGEVVCSSYVKVGLDLQVEYGWMTGGASPLHVSRTAAKTSDIDSGPDYL